MSFLGGILNIFSGSNQVNNSETKQHGVATQQQLNVASNGIGSSLHTYSSGQAPVYASTSTYALQGYAYILPNGAVVANPPDITPDQVDEMNRQWKEKHKQKFLEFPVDQREAFLMVRRARAVEEGMVGDGAGLSGANGTGYTTSGLASWTDVNHLGLTLAEYETARADALMDEVLKDKLSLGLKAYEL
jgi:hypothetical protein